ncbi:ATP-dependent DNA helicase pif1-like [Linepithema humile]|uniref:ATP-dependent DNA helicase pif1-like n=1 Tax=Linepithema humile TaxID=83485 RepID=UPI00351F10EA
MAFTGIAATLLPAGKTVHKTFGLPVPLFADSTSAIKIQSKEAQYLKNTDIFIWDEAPMSPRYALEIMDRTLRDIMNNNLPFGGKIVLLGGDFRQLLPIKVHGTRNEIVNLSIKFSAIWKHFVNYSLTQNMRVLPEEIEFAKFLLDMGDGILNDSNDNIQIPECCIAPINADIVEDIYGDLIRKKEFTKMAKCAILSARNTDVDEINKKVVELLDITNERIYTSVDSTMNCDDNGDIGEALLPEYLNSLSPSCLPPYELRLKPNCIIMLIRNLSINEGLCNGTRLMIIELTDHLLKCKILTGDKAGDIVFLNRITLYCENIYPFTFSRRQFPVKLAFAMTINKSQGQTFDRVGIDLRKDVFNHGQLYVAFSRVRSWQALKVFLGNQRDNRHVKNYVYKEIYM